MTADTYSNTLGYLIMGVGNDNNAWGGNANTLVFQIFEDAIANALTSVVTGGTLDLSGSPPPAAASQVRYAALIFTGTLTSNQIVQVPNLSKFWWVQNATSGNFTLTLKTPSGSASVALPQNSGWQLVRCDGANGIVVFPFNTQQVLMPDGSVSAPVYSNVNEPTSGWYRAGAGDWRLSILSVDRVQVTATGITITGNLSFTGSFAAGDGSAAAPGIAFASEAYSGLYRIGLGDIGFSLLQVKRVEATSTGFTWLGNTYAGTDLSPAAISSDQNNFNPPGLGLILTLGAITGGSAYTNGSYADVPLTGGTGSGARATIVVSGGAVTSVTLTNRGSGFAAADTLSVAAASIGGTGSGFAIPVATVDALTATCLRLNFTATCSLTGLAGGSASREIELVNVGTATGKFPANSASSSAANRFANSFNLAPGQSITLRYDATSSLWRPKNIATAISSCAIAAVSPDLLIVNHAGTENTKRDITCSEATLVDAVGNAIKFENVSVSIDYTITGAGGCDVGTRAASTDYYEWLISDGASIAGLASTASTAAGLTLPANYLYAKRVGWNHTNASSNLNRIRQAGQDGQYIVVTGSATPNLPSMGSVLGSVTTPTWVAVSVTGFVPATASRIRAILVGAGTTGYMMMAPNNSYGAWNSQTNPPPFVQGFNTEGTLSGDMALESSNIYGAVNATAGTMFCVGWKDPV